MSEQPGQEYSCTYPLKSRLTALDADRIAQASVYLADCIYLPASAALDPATSSAERHYVNRRLSELKDIGAVQLWRVEGGLIVSAEESRAVSGPEDITITQDAYEDMYSDMMSRLVTNRTFFRGSDAFDGVAEVVEGKNALFLFALKDLLGAKALLLDDRATVNVSRYFTTLTSQFTLAEDVVKRLAVRLHLPDIAELRVDQIESLRHHMPAFRARLLSASGDDQLLFYEREEMVERITNLLIDEFFDYVHSMRDSVTMKRRHAQPGWSFLQLMLAPLLTQSNSARFFGWSGETPTAPEMMLLELHQIQHEQSTGAMSPRK
ncbi:MAG TPA: hypothetical protein VMV92_15375 [Streptosporangiaceae bacterium]|nr:hypothetical protein [Streptosporangiaceae bacterium]